MIPCDICSTGNIASVLKSIFMESKTYVFGENGNNGMMSLLAPLMQKSGLDPNLLLAMNRNNGGFGGEGGCFSIAANDIKNPKQVCDNPS